VDDGPRGGILGGPIDQRARLAARLPPVDARPGLRVLHRGSGFLGDLVALDDGRLTLRSPTGRERSFRNEPGAFAVDGTVVRLVVVRAEEPDAPAVAPHLSGAHLTGATTTSGSRALAGAKARVAQASRILVEGVHDAELVEQVWGDDLRIEGIVVERLDGADLLASTLAELQPGPARRIGVLLDHVVEGSKESRIARAVRSPHVLVTGTPYVDVWEAVRPSVVGLDRWPTIPMGTDWKTGAAAALGFADPRDAWRHVRAAARTWKDLEQPLVGAVEALIDFVTTVPD
jgi:hypothetical protein